MLGVAHPQTYLMVHLPRFVAKITIGAIGDSKLLCKYVKVCKSSMWTSSMNKTPGTNSAIPWSIYLLTTWLISTRNLSVTWNVFEIVFHSGFRNCNKGFEAKFFGSTWVLLLLSERGLKITDSTVAVKRVSLKNCGYGTRWIWGVWFAIKFLLCPHEKPSGWLWGKIIHQKLKQ